MRIRIKIRFGLWFGDLRFVPKVLNETRIGNYDDWAWGLGNLIGIKGLGLSIKIKISIWIKGIETGDCFLGISIGHEE